MNGYIKSQWFYFMQTKFVRVRTFKSIKILNKYSKLLEHKTNNELIC